MLKSRFLLISLIFLLIGGLTVVAQDADKEAKKAAKEAAKEAKQAAKQAEKEAKKAGKEVGDAVEEAVDAATGDEGDGFKAKKHDEYPYPSVRDREYIDYVRPKKKDQQDAFIERKYTHPSPPKSQWELGLDIGALMISGDVKAKPGLAIGGHIRKSFGYVFSVRGSFMAGTTTGRNWQGSQGWSAFAGNDANGGSIYAEPDELAPNGALGGDDRYDRFNEGENTPDYRGLNGNIVFYNYQTKIRELTLSGIVNLNNVKFHKRRNLFSWYGIFGVGGLIYNAKMDQLDGDGNEYDYSTIGPYADDDTRKDRIAELKDLWDGDFESQAEKHFDDYWLFGSINDRENIWNYRPTAHIGIGTAIKVTRRINIGLESKVTYTNDDLLDGQRWQEWGALSRDYDTYVFTNASININLGGKNTVEPLWWMNPLDYAYDDMNKKPCCEDLEIPDLTDSDGDGVPDMFDDEPDSRKECPVNTRGVMLDTDGDGILDCDDCQPLTPKHLIDKINDCGEALEENCCDELRGKIKDIEDYLFPDCDDSMLPNILFKSNCYGVNDNFRPQLQVVADYLRTKPNISLCVVGNVDGPGAYNQVLAWKRANEVRNILVSEFGVNPSQLKVQYRAGEVIGGGMAGYGKKKAIDAEGALNRRVDFKCCDKNSSEMPKPSGPDAGRKCK